jgi:hypothetical protein
MQRRQKGSKKKSPNFVHEGENLFALNRAARRKAAKLGITVISVPMPTLSFYWDESDPFRRRPPKLYDLVHITGQRVPFEVQYMPPKPDRNKYTNGTFKRA